MEKHLYYCYLKYQREHKKKWKDIYFSIPKNIYISLGLIFIFGIMTLYYALTFKLCYSYLCMCLEIIHCGIMRICVENYKINRSKEYLTQNIQKYNRVWKWLSSCSITEKSEIEEYKRRMVLYVQDKKSEICKKQERIDKWIQILIIPVLLVGLKIVLNYKQDVFSLISGLIISIIAFLVVYFIIMKSIKILDYIFEGNEINKMQDFIDDLQGVLDTQFSNRSLALNQNQLRSNQ